MKTGLIEFYTGRMYPVKRPTRVDYWIYAISSPITGLTKVGITQDLFNRFSQLQCQSGMDLIIETAVQLERGVCEQASDAEKVIHEYYKGLRRNGEWFALTDQDKSELKELFYTVDGINIITNENNQLITQ